MSIFVPFNHQPTSVAVKTGSYTIPAGSYARITVSLSASARGRILATGAGQTPSFGHHTSDADSKTATFFVPTGTVLNVTTSTASATDSGYNSNDELFANASSSCTFTIGGTTALECNVGASCATKNGSASLTSYVSANVTGDTDARYVVELFDELDA